MSSSTIILFLSIEGTALYKLLCELTGGEVSANQLVTKWIEGFRTKKVTEFNEDSFDESELHPLIRDEFANLRIDLRAKLTIYDVCYTVQNLSAWGAKENAVMAASTVSDFEEEIRRLTGDKLKLVLLSNINFCKQRDNYKMFGSAMDNFVSACRNISNDQSRHRLAMLIKGVFADANLADALLEEGAHP